MSTRREGLPLSLQPSSAAAARPGLHPQLTPCGPLRSEAVALRPEVRLGAAAGPTRSVSLHAGPKFVPQRAATHHHHHHHHATTALDLDAMFAAKASTTVAMETGHLDGGEDMADVGWGVQDAKNFFARRTAPKESRAAAKAKAAEPAGKKSRAAAAADAVARGAAAVVRRTRNAMDARAKKNARLDKFDMEPFDIPQNALVAPVAPMEGAEEEQGLVREPGVVYAEPKAPGAPAMYSKSVIAVLHKEHTKDVDGTGTFKVRKGDQPLVLTPFGLERPKDFPPTQTEIVLQRSKAKLLEYEQAGQTALVKTKQAEVDKLEAQLKRENEAAKVQDNCAARSRAHYSKELIEAFSAQLRMLKSTTATGGESLSNLSAILGFAMCHSPGVRPWGLNGENDRTADELEKRLIELAKTKEEIQDPNGPLFEKDVPYTVQYGNRYPVPPADAMKSIVAFVALPLPPKTANMLEQVQDNFHRQPCYADDLQKVRDDTLPIDEVLKSKYHPGKSIVRLEEEEIRGAFSHVLYPVHVQTRSENRQTLDTAVVHWGSHPIFVPRDEYGSIVPKDFRADGLGERILTEGIDSKPSADLLNYRVVAGDRMDHLMPVAEVGAETPPQHMDLMLAWSAMTLGHGINNLAKTKIPVSDGTREALKKLLALSTGEPSDMPPGLQALSEEELHAFEHVREAERIVCCAEGEDLDPL